MRTSCLTKRKPRWPSRRRFPSCRQARTRRQCRVKSRTRSKGSRERKMHAARTTVCHWTGDGTGKHRDYMAAAAAESCWGLQPDHGGNGCVLLWQRAANRKCKYSTAGDRHIRAAALPGPGGTMEITEVHCRDRKSVV